MKKISKKKILIADDEASLRLLLERLLSQNYIILEAKNGKEAVNIAYNQKPDLILMDMLMPEMDGLTACYTIKANQATKAIPVVMLTGVGYELDKKLSQELGAEGYVTKPFDSQQLMDVIIPLLAKED